MFLLTKAIPGRPARSRIKRPDKVQLGIAVSSTFGSDPAIFPTKLLTDDCNLVSKHWAMPVVKPDDSLEIPF